MKNPINMYMEDIQESDNLSHEEQIALVKLAQKGNCKAMHKLVMSCTKFVVKMAHRYKNQGVELDDLISAGNEGLIDAVNKFDLSKKITFLTYAVWWIRHEIFQELNCNSRMFKIHGGISNEKYKYDKAVQKLTQKFHRHPTINELYKETKIPIKHIKRLETLNDYVSLDKPLNIEGAKNAHIHTLHDSVESIRNNLSHNELDEDEENLSSLKQKIMLFLESPKLTPKQRDIIKLSYGIKDGYEYTLEEIGNKYEQTRENIRIIKQKSEKMLRCINAINKETNEIHFVKEELA